MLKFEVYTGGLEDIARHLAEGCTKAEHALAQQVKKDTMPFVPALTGSLSQRTKVEGNAVIYPGPYARYLYQGKLMVDPETGSPWAKKGAKKILTDRNLVFNTSVHGQAQSHWFEASKAQNLKKWERVAKEAVIKYGTK